MARFNIGHIKFIRQGITHKYNKQMFVSAIVFSLICKTNPITSQALRVSVRLPQLCYSFHETRPFGHYVSTDAVFTFDSFSGP